LLEAFKSGEDAPAEAFCDIRGRVCHNIMGDYLLDKLAVCKINDALHIYDDGIYRPGEEILHGYMVKLVPTITDSKRREVYKYIKVNLKTPTRQVSPPDLIPFKTKIYDLQNDMFLDYDKEYVFLNRFPYDYIPDAPEQPFITQTIADIADHDREVIQLLYEAIGNCFFLLNSYRGAVMLYGKDGNNSKSTLLNMITQLLGRENTSFLSLQDTMERFRLVEIYGKAANIGDDIPDTYFPDSAIFKKLVTGEYVTAEKKGQDAFPFRPFAKMFFAMNGLPPVSDKSKAFFGRLLLIPLNRDFSKAATCNVDLKNRVWTQQEMEYLVTLAMEGLKRLIKQGQFTRPKSVRDALQEYERENNPIMEFLEECEDIEGRPIADIYQKYRIWSEASGHRNFMTRRKFTDTVINVTGFKSIPIKHPFFGQTKRSDALSKIISHARHAQTRRKSLNE
jgi:putative DNA primase/helicase